MSRTTSLVQYNKKNVRHVFSSYMNTYSRRRIVGITAVSATLHTPYKWCALVYWYIKFSTVLSNRKYFLSKAQKKYQTVAITSFMLDQKKSRLVSSADLLTFLHNEVIPDLLKQTYDNTLWVGKNQVKFHVPELPFNIYNQSGSFQQLFPFGMPSIGFTLQSGTLSTPAPLLIFLFLFYKYLMVQVD